VPALALNGYTPCYVTLPSRAMDDMQISSEYVAYNLHYLSALSGGLKPAIISHSQGGPVSQWALQFWPSTRSVARAFIPLAPDFDGVDLAISDLSAICDLIDCQPSLWQQSQGSNYYKALHAGDFKALVPTTSIWSKVCHWYTRIRPCTLLISTPGRRRSNPSRKERKPARRKSRLGQPTLPAPPRQPLVHNRRLRRFCSSSGRSQQQWHRFSLTTLAQDLLNLLAHRGRGHGYVAGLRFGSSVQESA
jgi:hypothetical protein